MKKYLLFLLLVLAFAVRIYKINSPLIGVHSWRQADTAAIARNFYENGYKFLYPQIDWGGDSPGYVETEFPLYSFVVALFYQFFGVQEFWGRFLSAIFSLITIYFLYLLVKKFTDSKTAFWSCFFFSFLPLNIFYSRTFMPEPAMLMSSVLGIYFFSQWLDLQKWRFFLLSLIFITLAALLKIPSLYLGLPLFFLAWLKFGKKVFLQWTLWLYAILVFLAVGLWYYHAHQIFLQSGLTFNIWGYGIDKWGNWDLLLTFQYWYKLLLKSLAERHFSWLGFPIFLWGLFIKRANKSERLFDFWLLALLVYFVIVAKGNFAHEYYQLPFMLPATVFMGKVLARHWSPKVLENKKSFILTVCLVGIAILGAGRNYLYLRIENPQRSETFKLAEKVKQKIQDNAPIIAVDGNDPALLYLSHKKGWHFWGGELEENYLEGKIRQGAKYIVGYYRHFDETQPDKIKALFGRHQVLWDQEGSFIVKLSD